MGANEGLIEPDHEPPSADRAHTSSGRSEVREEGTAVTTAAGNLVRRYADAGARDDFETMEALRHHEWQEAWPQSGEIVTGSANYRVVRTQRPEGAPRVEPRRVGGSGACWWSEAIIHCAGGSRWLGQPLRVARRTRLTRADLLRASRHSSRLAGAMGGAGGAGRHVDPPTPPGSHRRRRAGGPSPVELRQPSRPPADLDIPGDVRGPEQPRFVPCRGSN